MQGRDLGGSVGVEAEAVWAERWGCGCVGHTVLVSPVSPDQEHGPGHWWDDALWVGAFRVRVTLGLRMHTGWGVRPPCSPEHDPKAAENASVWGGHKCDPDQEGRVPQSSVPSQGKGHRHFQRELCEAQRQGWERELRRLGGEWRADSRVDFCLSGYYTVDLKRQMTAVAEEAIIESAMKH